MRKIIEKEAFRRAASTLGGLALGIALYSTPISYTLVKNGPSTLNENGYFVRVEGNRTTVSTHVNAYCNISWIDENGDNIPDYKEGRMLGPRPNGGILRLNCTEEDKKLFLKQIGE